MTLARERAASYDAAGGSPRGSDDAASAGGGEGAGQCVGGDGDGGASAAALQGLRGSLANIGDHLRALVDQVPREDEVAGLTVELLDDCFGELKRVEGASVALKAKLVGCAAAAKAHEQAGAATTDAYLRERLGVSGREAKKQAELSKALNSMDGAADALADGRLGAEQAGILGRAARDGRLGSGDEVQEQLLEAATSSSPEDLQRTVRRREQAADADALRRDENRAHALRRASMSKQASGMWSLHAELDPVNGEIVNRAIRAFTTPDAAGTPPEERRSPEKRTADGLVDLAAAALRGGSATSGGVRPHISVIVMADPKAGDASVSSAHEPDAAGGPDGGEGSSPGTLFETGHDGRSDGRPEGERNNGGGRPAGLFGAGVTGSGSVLSPEATARIVCDSALARIVMAAPSQVLDVGRTKRNWSGPQRRAIIARDGTCRGPSCDRPSDWCDVHHIHWWQDDGPSDLDNGLLLCRRHHRLVHEGGWQVELEPDTGRAVFTDPRGKEQATLPRGAPTLLS